MLIFMRKKLTHALRSNLVKTSLNYCGCVVFIDDMMLMQQNVLHSSTYTCMCGNYHLLVLL